MQDAQNGNCLEPRRRLVLATILMPIASYPLEVRFAFIIVLYASACRWK